MPTETAEEREKRNRLIAAKIANNTIARLRDLGLDCVHKGKHDDVSPQIHDAVFFSTLDVLNRP